MSVSLIILHYNTPELLTTLLGYIANDAQSLDWQVLVVDNGSVENPLPTLAAKFPCANLIRSEQNVGFAAGNNIGIRAATGEIIFLLNSDIVVSITQLQQLVNYLVENPSVAAVSPQLLTAANEPQAFAFGDSPRPIYLIRRALTAVFKNSSLHNWHVTKPVEAEWITAACLGVRRAVIDQVGLFDENFFLYFEDIDWCVRMRQAGWQVVYNPEVQVMHLGGYSQPQRDIANQLYYKSMNYYYHKHFPKWRWLPRLLLPFYHFARRG